MEIQDDVGAVTAEKEAKEKQFEEEIIEIHSKGKDEKI